LATPPVNDGRFTEQAATELAAALTSGDRARFAATIAAYDGWKPPEKLLKELAGWSMELIPGTVTDNGDGTTNAIFAVGSGSGSGQWKVTLIRHDSRWQVLDTTRVKR
jgi:hypothetical protein